MNTKLLSLKFSSDVHFVACPSLAPPIHFLSERNMSVFMKTCFEASLTMCVGKLLLVVSSVLKSFFFC